MGRKAAAPSRFCTSIAADSLEGMVQKAELAIFSGTELVEFRIDRLMSGITTAEIGERLGRFARRAVMTVRTDREGGGFSGSEVERLRLLTSLARMRPAYLDVELSTAKENERWLGSLPKKVERIISWHDFEGTPRHRIPQAGLRGGARAWDDSQGRHHGHERRGQPQDDQALRREPGEGRLVLHGNAGDCLEDDVDGRRGPCRLRVSPRRPCRPRPDLDRHAPRVQGYDPEGMTTTDHYCILGKDVSRSLSPAMMNAAFSSLGIDADYSAVSVAEPDFSRKFESLVQAEVSGMNVTIPFKTVVIPRLSWLDAVATRTQAVNTIKKDAGGRYLGHNTDPDGILGALTAVPASLEVRTAMLIGAGGAARAFCEAMNRMGCVDLAVVVRDVGRSRQFVQDMEKAFPRLNLTLAPHGRPPSPQPRPGLQRVSDGVRPASRSRRS